MIMIPVIFHTLKILKKLGTDVDNIIAIMIIIIQNWNLKSGSWKIIIITTKKEKKEDRVQENRIQRII